MALEIAPRPISANEVGILKLAVLSLPASRCRDGLSRQIGTIRVVGGLPLYIDLESDARAEDGCFQGRNNPIEGTVYKPDGGVTGGILVWIQDGALHALECFTYEDEAPSDFPSPTQVRFDRPPRDIARH
jgi:hypothetical protein